MTIPANPPGGEGTQHSPGPWSSTVKMSLFGETPCIDSANGFQVASTVACPNAEANARLIAAAPDLLEALDQLLDDMGEDGLCVCQAAKDMARAAILRANCQNKRLRR